MPVVSSIGFTNNVVPIGPDQQPEGQYVYAPTDTFASLQKAPTGATFDLFLPGPNVPRPPGALPTPLPAGGDFYRFADPLGKLTGAHSVTVHGSGFPILGSDTIILSSAGSEAEFTFDDTAQAWIACLCFPQVD